MLARIAAAVLAPALLGPSAEAQMLRGTVVDSLSGQPVEGAQVTALAVAEVPAGLTVTNRDGQFAFRVDEAGNYRLRVRRLGYSPRITQPIAVDSSIEVSVRLWLTPVAVPLDTVNVVAEEVPVETRLGYLVDAGFYRRQRFGWGYYLTRDEIERNHPTILGDVLRDLPGVRVSCANALNCTVTMRAARTMFMGKVCSPSMVLDGVLLSPGGSQGSSDVGVDSPLKPFNLEAIEVYPGPEGVPVQWGGYLSPCGAIIAWSRR